MSSLARFLHYIVVSVLPVVLPAYTQDWKPNRPVELIVGSTPGGGNDQIVRSIAKIFQELKIVEVPVTVINKAGGAGSIAYTYLNQHPGDAHYIALNPVNLLTNYITGLSQIHYRDITPLVQLLSEYTVVLVRKESPLVSVRDLIERLRRDSGGLTVSVGTARGNGPHISLALGLQAGGVDVKKLKTVVFQSGGESNTALLGGHIDVVTSSASNATSGAAVGRLRAIAISSPQRMGGGLANVPTWREQGVDMVFDNWRGIVGPTGLSPAQIAFWEKAFAQLAENREWKQVLDKQQWGNSYMPSAASRKHLEAQYEMIRGALTEIGLSKQ